MTHRLAGRPVPVHGNLTQRALTSERASLTFDLTDRFWIVGERINPTGKKKLQQELREGSFELVTQFAQEQEERGASILDVNMGMSGIDEKGDDAAGAGRGSGCDEAAAVHRFQPCGRAGGSASALSGTRTDQFDFVGIRKSSKSRCRWQKKYGAMFVLCRYRTRDCPKI